MASTFACSLLWRLAYPSPAACFLDRGVLGLAGGDCCGGEDVVGFLYGFFRLFRAAAYLDDQNGSGCHFQFCRSPLPPSLKLAESSDESSCEDLDLVSRLSHDFSLPSPELSVLTEIGSLQCFFQCNTLSLGLVRAVCKVFVRILSRPDIHIFDMARCFSTNLLKPSIESFVSWLRMRNTVFAELEQHSAICEGNIKICPSNWTGASKGTPLRKTKRQAIDVKS